MKKKNRLGSYAAAFTACLVPISPMLTLSVLAAGGGSVPSAGLRDCVLALSVIAAAGLVLMIVIAYRHFRRYKQ